MLVVVLALFSGSAAAGTDFLEGVGLAAPWSTGQVSPTRIDFGPAEISPAAGFLRDSGFDWSAEDGYGWFGSGGPLQTRARSCSGVADESESFVFSVAERAWETAIAPGDYDVTYTVGDCRFDQGPHRVDIEGERVVADVETTGDLLDGTETVRVLDGRLTVEIGGGGGTTMLANATIVRSSSQPSVLHAFNFEPPGAPTPDGFTAETGEVYGVAGTYGWDRSLTAHTRQRSVEDNALLDTLIFVPGAAATFEVAVPPGVYRIVGAVGDAAWGQGPHRVTAEGETLIDGATTAGGEFLALEESVTVLDGRLTVEVGGGGGLTTLDYLTVVVETPLDSVQRFDFGPSGVAPQEGHTRDSGAPISGEATFGWSHYDLPDRSRSCSGVTPREDTFVYTHATTTWETEIANGEYWVRAAVGDCRHSQGPHRLVVEGATFVDDEITAGGELLVRAARVRVLDGRLTITAGGGGGNTALDYLEILEVADPPSAMLAYDFGPTDGDSAAGFTLEGGHTYGTSGPYGWDRSLTSFVRERGAHPDPLLDSFVYVPGAAATFEAEVPPGTYRIQGAAGDPAWPQGPQRVVVEGQTLLAEVVTSAGEFAPIAGTIDVFDGLLTLEAGGAGGLTTLSYVSAMALDPERSWKISFQPGASEPPTGMVIDAGDAYDATRGYGWADDFLLNANRTRERGIHRSQMLDTFVYTGGAVESWSLDVPDGGYFVRVLVGDPAWAQGPHRVTVEGFPVIDDVTTPAEGYATGTICTYVTDSRLDVTIGGAAGNTTLNAILVESRACAD